MRTRQSIVVIDDSTLVHRLVEQRLEDLGVDIRCVTTGQAGLATIQEHPPDLVLLDIDMPDISGFDVCRLLKANPQTHDIAVIFLSGINQAVEKVKGFDLGAVDYVTKPFDPSELRARVRSALNTRALMNLLTTQAHIDGLTGLHNRRHFDLRLKQEIDACTRYRRRVGLMMIDIDHFKRINDIGGHPKGDLVLQRIADVLCRVPRSSDIVCRYGGEEFAVLLQDFHRDIGQTFGQRLLREIRDDEDLQSILREPVTVSMGIASSDQLTHITAEDLIRLADESLYHSKNTGRNRATLAWQYTPIAATNTAA